MRKSHYKLIRHSTHRLRVWLLAAAAILLVTSVIEAGHAHGIFTQVNDNCILCQHSVALDKVLISSAFSSIALLFFVFVFKDLPQFTPTQKHGFALIRAPPASLHRR
jgi:hypothetical protein